jgi:hypothetical protein
VKTKVSPVSFACLITILALLFTSPLFAEGLTLSLSDPALGTIVLKKENPDEKVGGGLGGVSVGEFTYNGESLQIHLYRGERVWHGTPPPELRRGYAQEYQMDVRIFDQDGTFTRSSG